MADYETLSLVRVGGARSGPTEPGIDWRLRALEAEAALRDLGPWSTGAGEQMPIDGGLGGKLPWLIYGLAVGSLIGLLL